MGRPKGSKNRPRLEVVGASPTAGHNSEMTEDELAKLHLQHHVPSYEKALAAKKAADAEFKNVCKRIKTEGGSVDSVKLTISLKTPEGEKAFKALMEAQIRVAKWNGLPVNTQGTLFEVDRRPGVEKAADDGKRDGLAGKTLVIPEIYASHADTSEAYMKAWHEGQAVNISRIKPEGPTLLRPDQADQASRNPFGSRSDPGAPNVGADDGNDEDASSKDPWPDDEQIADRAGANADEQQGE